VSKAMKSAHDFLAIYTHKRKAFLLETKFFLFLDLCTISIKKKLISPTNNYLHGCKSGRIVRF